MNQRYELNSITTPHAALQKIFSQAKQIDFASWPTSVEKWSLELVVAHILPNLDSNCESETMRQVIQVLHAQSGDDESGLAALIEWAQISGQWSPSVCTAMWNDAPKGIAEKGAAPTLSNLISRIKSEHEDATRQIRDQAMDFVYLQIENCFDPRALKESIATLVSRCHAFSDVEREQIASRIQVRSSILNSKFPIRTVRSWVRARRVDGNLAMPEWAKPWVYLTEGDKFFNTTNKAEISQYGFRAAFNRFMPFNQKGHRERADQFCIEQCDMPVVSHKAYLPGAGITFEMYGLKWVNLYRPESVPDLPHDLSTDDLKAIEVVKHHLVTYLADQRERDLLLSWISWNVQHPGQKIRWAPYVHGVPGDGKSFFIELLGCVMGGQNVRSLNGSTLESNFTDWANGYAIVGVEEMKQHGKNRYDIMNRLKPYITNTAIEIHPKGKASYTAPNVTNYMIVSNYLDGAPIDESDRRYLFLSSQLTISAAKQLSENGYFKRLFASIQNHAGAIRKWLLEYQFHAEFDANGRAPHTKIRATVVEMSKSDIQICAEDLISEGGLGFCEQVFSSAHLTKAIFSRLGIKPATNQVNSLMSRLGYRLAFSGRKKKWNQQPCSIWIQASLDWPEAEIIKRLDLTKSNLDFLD